MVKVKICGITNAQDALWAANLGADYIGLNFYSESSRKVSVKHAKELVAQLPPFVMAVGLFVNEEPKVIEKIMKSVPLKAVQLHGQESPEFCASIKALGAIVIKVFRLQGTLDPVSLEPYYPYVDYYLFDTYSSQTQGGTGEVFDWAWIQNISTISKPWFLAGGLTAENVIEAIKQTHAGHVDVCSGIERSPTRKDYDAMKHFIQSVKALR